MEMKNQISLHLQGYLNKRLSYFAIVTFFIATLYPTISLSEYNGKFSIINRCSYLTKNSVIPTFWQNIIIISIINHVLFYLDPCKSSPCLNDGRCNEIEDGVEVGAYLCYCTPGWEGKNCHISKLKRVNLIRLKPRVINFCFLSY